MDMPNCTETRQPPAAAKCQNILNSLWRAKSLSASRHSNLMETHARSRPLDDARKKCVLRTKTRHAAMREALEASSQVLVRLLATGNLHRNSRLISMGCEYALVSPSGYFLVRSPT